MQRRKKSNKRRKKEENSRFCRALKVMRSNSYFTYQPQKFLLFQKGKKNKVEKNTIAADQKQKQKQEKHWIEGGEKKEYLQSQLQHCRLSKLSIIHILLTFFLCSNNLNSFTYNRRQSQLLSMVVLVLERIIKVERVMDVMTNSIQLHKLLLFPIGGASWRTPFQSVTALNKLINS